MAYTIGVRIECQNLHKDKMHLYFNFIWLNRTPKLVKGTKITNWSQFSKEKCCLSLYFMLHLVQELPE